VRIAAKRWGQALNENFAIEKAGSGSGFAVIAGAD
jgi:hypothetical protein